MIVLRHHDYQLTLPSIPPEGLVGVPLRLDSDAPFILQRVKARAPGVASGAFPWRFQNRKNQEQSNRLRTETPEPYAAFDPGLEYPINSAIICDIGNETGETITNGRLIFRGSKIFRDGAITAPTYPPRFSSLPDIFQVLVSNVVGGTSTGPMASFGIGRIENQLRITSKSDFALRYGVCDAFTLGVEGGPVNTGAGIPSFSYPGATFTDVWVWLKDQQLRPYSNEPIHVDDLFGRGFGPGFGVVDTGAVVPVNFQPGTFQPEIYIQRDHSLYFDVYRSDPASDPSVNLYFRFCGAQVFLS